MKKNTKKKVLTLTLVILLLSIAIVGGSLAWFTAEDEATNVFTVGSIEIVQHEKQHNKDTEDPNDLENFDQGKVLMPIVNIKNPAADPNYQDKIVTVENTGKNDAYVRTHIAIPATLEEHLHLDYNDQDGWNKVATVRDVKIDGVAHIVYVFEYQKKLTHKETTPEVLKGVYLDAKTDVQKNKNGELEFCYRNDKGEWVFSGFVVKDAEDNEHDVIVRVMTQAVQADGFVDAKDALVSAFGKPDNVDNIPFK